MRNFLGNFRGLITIETDRMPWFTQVRPKSILPDEAWMEEEIVNYTLSVAKTLEGNPIKLHCYNV